MPRTRRHTLRSSASVSSNLSVRVVLPTELAEEFEPCYGTIRTWMIKQADLEDGRRSDGTTTAEREEIRKLRKELRRLKQERDILTKRRNLCGAAWFAQETNGVPRGSSDS